VAGTATLQWILFIAQTVVDSRAISSVQMVIVRDDPAAIDQIFVENRDFYRAMRMHSADYAMARCLSVRPSVRQQLTLVLFPQNVFRFDIFCRNRPEENVKNTCCSLASYLLLSSSTLQQTTQLMQQWQSFT